MALSIPQTFIQNLIAHVDIVEIINSRVNLRKAGSNNFQALCPFHNEKTPSFNVNQRKQFYYCFGCGAHGNAISFLMDFEKLSFVEAVEELAAHAGLEVPKTTVSAQETQQQADILATCSLLERVSNFYQHQLAQSQTAANYLKQRGLSQETCQRFKIGYAPPFWEHLTSLYASNQKFTQQLLLAGMLLQKSNDGTSNNAVSNNYDNNANNGAINNNLKEILYARFRNRIMFPIRNRRGHIIGFGGRTIGDDQPKYLNSPETPLFHKGSELYGLYEARQTNRQLAYIVVVEGYMDVVMLAQHGITNAVATLGTAITSKQTQQLLQNCSTIIFCFDGDLAGKKAAWRALENVLPLMREGIEIKFTFLPEKEDPDSMVRKEGCDTFIRRLTTTSIALSDFMFQQLTNDIDISSLDGRAKLIQTAKLLLNKMGNGVFKQLLLNKLAEIAKTDVDTILNGSFKQRGAPPTTTAKFITTGIINSAGSSLLSLNPLQMAIGLLLNYPELALTISAEDVLIITTLDVLEARILIDLHELITKTSTSMQQNTTLGTILEHWREQPEAEYSLVARIAAWEPVISHSALKNEFNGIILKVREQGLETAIHALLQKANTHPLTTDEKIKLQELIKSVKNKKCILSKS